MQCWTENETYTFSIKNVSPDGFTEMNEGKMKLQENFLPHKKLKFSTSNADNDESFSSYFIARKILKINT